MSRGETAIQRGYMNLARTVIHIALADLKSDTALRNEAISFFESGSHLSLFCEVAGVDQKDMYALYERIAEGNE